MSARSRYAPPRAMAGRVAVQARSATGRPHANAAIDWLVVAFTTMAVLAIFMVSSELLAFLNVHYINSGGSFYEKLHPATYLSAVALLFLLIRNGDPVGEFNRIVSDAKLLLVFFFACALLMFQCVVLGRPFTGVIDTFLLPVMLAMIIWNLPPGRRTQPTVALHVAIWINIALGFYEYIVGHRLIPITLGDLYVTGDWRSTALLGHPLSAAGIIAMYVMGLTLRRRDGPRSFWLAPALTVAVCSLMAFGGRTALTAIVVVVAALGVVQLARLIRGERVKMQAVIMATCGIMLIGAASLVLLGSGVFDNMIDRFSSDNGSAHARIATLHFISSFDWRQLLLGTAPGYASSMQSMAGLDYGIENFWIASIVQYGIIQTALITIGVACFFVELLRRSSPAARVSVLFIVIIAAGSVSFSSKNISLAAYVTLIVLLLPRRQASGVRAVERNNQAGVYAPLQAARS